MNTKPTKLSLLSIYNFHPAQVQTAAPPERTATRDPQSLNSHEVEKAEAYIKRPLKAQV